MIRWFAKNGIAANFLMIAIVVAGVYTACYRIPLEVTPKRNYRTVDIEMTYRGATAKDVERAILIPIEQAMEGLQGLEEIDADGYRGMARIRLDAKPGVDLNAFKDDVQARVDSITTFPDETELPRIRIPDSTMWYEVLTVAVTGDLDQHGLMKVARRVQDDLLELDGISQVSMAGDSPYEISIEASPARLLSYGLGLQDLANAIRQSSVDMPAGAIDSESGSFSLRTRGQAYSAEEFARVPVVLPDGGEVTLGEVADIRDGFEEGEKRVEFNGKPAMFVEVMRTGQESAIQISDMVHDYVEKSRSRFPQGIDLFVYDDDSVSIRGRLNTLASSLLQGSVLVLVLLGLFLRPTLAFWIVVGIPVAFCGGILVMPWFGMTANVMSLFGFIIVVGIVVDDAIVTGENVYSKLKTGMDPLDAVVEGTHEVATPVTFGALTTMVAFIPLLFFDGRWGEFARQIPPVVAPVLLFSLIESKLILPSHLKHVRVNNLSTNGFAGFQARVAAGLEWFIEKVYSPTLKLAVNNRLSVLALFVTMAVLMAGYCIGGRMEFVAFPKVDRNRISMMLTLPTSTSLETTTRYMERITSALDQVREEFVDPGSGESLIQNVSRTIGAEYTTRDFEKSKGYISVEIMAPDKRSEPGPRNSEIAARWTELIGPIPEAERFRVYADSNMRRGDDDEESLTIELRGPDSPAKIAVAEQIKSILEGFDEEFSSVWAKINRGQDELELTLKPMGSDLGLTQAMLAQQIRQAFYGEEAQRVQRGIDLVRAMVRLPKLNRESLHTLEQLKVKTPSGANVPLSTVASIHFTKAPSRLERKDGAQVLDVGAQPVNEEVDVLGIAEQITPQLDTLCHDANLSYQFTGYVAEAEDTRKQTILGALIMLLTLYGLLSIPLKSVTQPFYVMLAVPFAVIGALLGHIIMDLAPSYLSVFGMLALAGIAVNDTLVMVDYVNRRLGEGAALREAALDAGARRFRPIMLTSVTTFVGLLPLLMDRSLQAQFLIPMAVSLAFGVLFATAVTLYLVPCSLLLGQDVRRVWDDVWAWYLRPFRRGTSTADTRQAA